MARVLNEAGLATLLIDLLSSEEESDRSYVFDIRLLADRLGDAMRWTRTLPELASVKIGLFGASTGAAAALRAAAQPESGVSAVVSRGGRPDLAAPLLGAVTAPTLLIVGSCDETVVELNRRALADLRGESRADPGPRGHAPVRGSPVRWNWWPIWPVTGSWPSWRPTRRPRLR